MPRVKRVRPQRATTKLKPRNSSFHKTKLVKLERAIIREEIKRVKAVGVRKQPIEAVGRLQQNLSSYAKKSGMSVEEILRKMDEYDEC